MSRKKTLGKGLGALLQNMEIPESINRSEAASMAAGISCIPIAAINANPFQPRKEFNSESLEELSISISQQGVIVPITVRKLTDNSYQLIAGERRLRASKIAGLTEIPAYIRVATDAQIMEMALVENIQRENLNAIETALSFQALIDECNLTQEQMSERVGKDRTTITNYLRLLKLPAEIQLAIQENTISMGHARAIINVEDPKQQIHIMHEILERGISVRQVEQMAANLRQPSPLKKKNTKKRLPEMHTQFQQTLSQQMGTAVEVSRSIRGKGSISISFANDKDFERISALITEKM